MSKTPDEVEETLKEFCDKFNYPYEEALVFSSFLLTRQNEVLEEKIFDALIPHVIKIDVSNKYIEIIVPENFKINPASVLNLFSKVLFVDTTDDILNKNQKKVFQGVLKSQSLVEYLNKLYQQYKATKK